MMQMSSWCMLWCECPLGSMLWFECPFVGMLWWECSLGSMLMMRMYPWCMLRCEWSIGACYDANALHRDAMNVDARLGMQWMQMSVWICNECKCPLADISWHRCFDANTIYSKIPFISKRNFHNAWNQNILKTWFIIHEKSSSFWLKAPKKLVITIRKSLNRAFT